MAKSQSNAVFPVIENRNDQIGRVFSKEESEVNIGISSMDAVVHFQESDSTLDIYYMERTTLYQYLLENSKSIFGVQIQGRLIGIHKNAKRFLNTERNLVLTSKMKITRNKVQKNKDLIELPEPTDYKHSSYKLFHSGFKLIDRNFKNL